MSERIEIGPRGELTEVDDEGRLIALICTDPRCPAGREHRVHRDDAELMRCGELGDPRQQVYPTHIRVAMRVWWRETRRLARATVVLSAGSHIYVAESFDELADLPRTAFLRVHVVSAQTGSMYEAERTVNDPPLLRAFSFDKVASIAPIVDEDAE